MLRRDNKFETASSERLVLSHPGSSLLSKSRSLSMSCEMDARDAMKLQETMVYLEILQTEKNYVQDLQTLCQQYYHYFRDQ